MIYNQWRMTSTHVGSLIACRILLLRVGDIAYHRYAQRAVTDTDSSIRTQ